MITLRLANGVKSALLIELEPLGHVIQTQLGNNAFAASAAFSPSVSTTVALGRLASSCNPYNGRSTLGIRQCHLISPVS